MMINSGKMFPILQDRGSGKLFLLMEKKFPPVGKSTPGVAGNLVPAFHLTERCEVHPELAPGLSAQTESYAHQQETADQLDSL